MTVSFDQYALTVTRKGLKKVNKPMLIPPIGVVKFILTFLPMLYRHTPPQKCSIEYVAIFL